MVETVGAPILSAIFVKVSYDGSLISGLGLAK